jgi:hypothetical protein
MRLASLGLASLLLLGCASGLKREGQCLADLTPEYVSAQAELDGLEASWRAGLRRRDADLNAPIVRVARESLRSDEPEAAYRKLAEARGRLRPTLVWYDRVYERWRTRMDEEQILSDVRMVLIPTVSGMLFYPLISWNVHSVFWDGADPDAESDPITRYCTDRLAQRNVLTGPRSQPAD